MTAIALRNLGERKLRSVLTSLAIVLGVMMVAGTYVLTDTINASFDRIFTQSNEGIDAVVHTREVVETDDGSVPPFPESVLEQVRQVDGVGEAAGHDRGLTRFRSSAPTASRAAATAPRALASPFRPSASTH